MTIVSSVAGLRAVGLLHHHHGASALPFAVESPTRLLLLVMMSIAFLGTWHLLYRR
jgi:hypothetical protein